MWWLNHVEPSSLKHMNHMNSSNCSILPGSTGEQEKQLQPLTAVARCVRPCPSLNGNEFVRLFGLHICLSAAVSKRWKSRKTGAGGAGEPPQDGPRPPGRRSLCLWSHI